MHFGLAISSILTLNSTRIEIMSARQHSSDLIPTTTPTKRAREPDDDDDDCTITLVRRAKRVKIKAQQFVDLTASSKLEEHTKACSFLSLPRELRDRIYRHALSSSQRLEPISSQDARRMRVAKVIHDAKAQGSGKPYPGLTVIDLPLLRVSKQVYAEANDVLLRTNTIRLTGDLYGPLEGDMETPCHWYFNTSATPHPEPNTIRLTRDLDRKGGPMRKRLEYILDHVHHLFFKLYSINPHAWWLKILQNKTNLHTLSVILREEAFLFRQGTFGHRWWIFEDEAKDDLRVLTEIKVIEKGRVQYQDRGHRTTSFPYCVHDEVEAFLGKEINPVLNTRAMEHD